MFMVNPWAMQFCREYHEKEIKIPTFIGSVRLAFQMSSIIYSS